VRLDLTSLKEELSYGYLLKRRRRAFFS
jgi:hypothetical protein